MAGRRTGDDNERVTVEAACCDDGEARAGLYERHYAMMVWVQEKDDRPPLGTTGETRTGRIVESSHPGSRFVLKPGEGHRDMGKYWRENLQYALQFRRSDDKLGQ